MAASKRWRPTAFFIAGRQAKDMGIAIPLASQGGWYFFTDYTRTMMQGPYSTEEDAKQMIDRRFGKRKAKE